MTGARLRTFFYITAERPHLRARRPEEATPIARRDAVYDGLSPCPQLLAQRLPCCLPDMLSRCATSYLRHAIARPLFVLAATWPLDASQGCGMLAGACVSGHTVIFTRLLSFAMKIVR